MREKKLCLRNINDHWFYVTGQVQKRLRRERRARRQMQEQLETEVKRRIQLEEALKAAGAGDQIRIINGKIILITISKTY